MSLDQATAMGGAFLPWLLGGLLAAAVWVVWRRCVVLPPLLWAARRGDVERIVALLDAGTCIDTVASYRRTTALLEAVAAVQPQVVRALLARGADVRRRDRAGMTALTLAARAGQVSVARMLLDAGADVDAQTTTGATPMLVAAQCGHEEVVGLLLSRSARVDTALPHSGATALIIAAVIGHAGIVQTLLEHGAATDIHTREGGVALDYATEPAVIGLLRNAHRTAVRGAMGEPPGGRCAAAYAE